MGGEHTSRLGKGAGLEVRSMPRGGAGEGERTRGGAWKGERPRGMQGIERVSRRDGEGDGPRGTRGTKRLSGLAREGDGLRGTLRASWFGVGWGWGELSCLVAWGGGARYKSVRIQPYFF